MKKPGKKFFAIIAVILVIGLIGGYVIANSGNKSGRIGEISSEEADKEAQRLSNIEDKLIVTDNQGQVEVGAMFLNPTQDDEKYLIFDTQIGTHSVNLDQYDFSKVAVFRTSEGIVLKDEIIWEKGEGQGGHHYSGYYKVPKEINGKPVITKDTSYIELSIENVDGVKSRSMKWGKEALALLTK